MSLSYNTTYIKGLLFKNVGKGRAQQALSEKSEKSYLPAVDVPGSW